MKAEIKPLLGAGVRLRLLQAEDLPLTRFWRNQDHIRRWFFFDGILSEENHLAWYREYLAQEHDYTFMIESLPLGGQPVGQIALYNIAADRAELGRLMVGEPTAAGKGIAVAAVRCLLQFGFAALDLTGIYLEVYADNAAARRVYAKCGFGQSGSYIYPPNGREVLQLAIINPAR